MDRLPEHRRRWLHESLCRIGRRAAQCGAVACWPTRLAARSRGVRTGRTCCSTRRSAPRTRRSRASTSCRVRRDSAKTSSATSSRSRRGRARRRFRARASASATRPRLSRLRPNGTDRRDGGRRASGPRQPTRVVFDDIRRRISFLPVGVNARSVAISPDGKTALLGASAAGQANLYTYSLDELSSEPAVARQLTSTPGFKGNAQFSPDGKEVYYLENGRIRAINVESRQVRQLNVTADVDVDFATEKLAVFHQAWSILADNFFDREDERRRLEGDRDAVRAVRRGCAEHRGFAPHHALHDRRAQLVALRNERPELLAAAERGPPRPAVRSRRVRARRTPARERGHIAGSRGDRRRSRSGEFLLCRSTGSHLGARDESRLAAARTRSTIASCCR